MSAKKIIRLITYAVVFAFVGTITTLVNKGNKEYSNLIPSIETPTASADLPSADSSFPVDDSSVSQSGDDDDDDGT